MNKARIIKSIGRIFGSILALALLSGWTNADKNKAQQAAKHFAVKYGECLLNEAKRLAPTRIQAQDFAILLAGACLTERQQFLGPFVDYLAMEHPEITDPTTHMRTFEGVAKQWQDHYVKEFIEMRLREPR